MSGAKATATICISSHCMSSPVSCIMLLAGETPMDSTCSSMRTSDPLAPPAAARSGSTHPVFTISQADSTSMWKNFLKSNMSTNKTVLR